MRSLADAAEETVRPLLRKRGFREAAIVRRWHDIIGPQLGLRTAPVSLARGVLTVRVDAAFATEFQHRSAMVLDRIATVFGKRVARRIVLRQGPVRGRWERSPSRPPLPQPSADARRSASARTAGIRHDPLRAALAGLVSTVAADREHSRRIRESARPGLPARGGRVDERR